MRLASSSIRELRQQRFTAISTTPYKATSLTSLAQHTLGAGVYLGEYAVEADDNSLVFDVDSAGNQEGPPFFPVRIINNANKINLLSGIYLEDTWQITEKLRANVGVRWDRLSGFTYNNQIDPTTQSGLCGRGRTPLFTPVSPGICKCRAFRASRPALLQRLPAPPAWREPESLRPRPKTTMSGMPV